MVRQRDLLTSDSIRFDDPEGRVTRVPDFIEDWDSRSSCVRLVNDLFEIIHEDGELLVVNKPAGLVCHPTKRDERSSLIGRVRLYLGTAEGRLVNRLDRETSGLVLVAKSAAVASELGKLIETGAVGKEYLALVHGLVAEDEFVIDAPLGNDDRSAVAIKDCVRQDGAGARTRVQVLLRGESEDKKLSLLRVEPLTGRKHQIRIHLSHVGHAIVGDKIYGADEQIYLRFVEGRMTEADRRRLILESHALHAMKLSFRWLERDWTFRAPLPEEVLSVSLNKWREWRGSNP